MRTSLDLCEQDDPFKQSGVGGENMLYLSFCGRDRVHRHSCQRLLQSQAFVLYTFCVICLS